MCHQSTAFFSPSDPIIIHTEEKLTEITAFLYLDCLDLILPGVKQNHPKLLEGSPARELSGYGNMVALLGALTWPLGSQRMVVQLRLVPDVSRPFQRKSEGGLWSTLASAAQTRKDQAVSTLKSKWLLDIYIMLGLSKNIRFSFSFLISVMLVTIWSVKSKLKELYCKTCSLVIAIILKYLSCGLTEISKGSFQGVIVNPGLFGLACWG